MEQQKLSRTELYDLVWSEPMVSLSKKYNISDAGLRKICTKLNIPLPKYGHWQRIQYGKEIIRQLLPEDTKVEQSLTLTLRDESTINIVGEITPFKLLQVEIENALKSLLRVPDRLTKPDKMVTATKDYLQSKWPERNRLERGLDTSVTDGNIPRALRFWDTLIKALRARGHDVQVKGDSTYAILQEHEFRIYVREKSPSIWSMVHSITYKFKGNHIMASYDFLNLAPDEFEILSRDLLQKFLSLHLESFKAGKDGGTDLRGYKSEDGTRRVYPHRLCQYAN